jgi:hypothetical protein
MDEIRREAWSLYKYGDWSQGVHLTVKEKIAALRLLKECNEAKFALLEKGSSMLNIKGMKEKLENIQTHICCIIIIIRYTFYLMRLSTLSQITEPVIQLLNGKNFAYNINTNEGWLTTSYPYIG